VTTRVSGTVASCTWLRGCHDAAAHLVWCETRPGLVVHEAVCARHLPDARTFGYRQDEPPIPPPDGLGVA
jgi:hypothetical protein